MDVAGSSGHPASDLHASGRALTPRGEASDDASVEARPAQQLVHGPRRRPVSGWPGQRIINLPGSDDGPAFGRHQEKGRDLTARTLEPRNSGKSPRAHAPERLTCALGRSFRVIWRSETEKQLAGLFLE